MLIKEEEGGEVSRWLFGLPVGAVVGFRGPRWEWIAPASWREGEVKGKNVVFLAGGTGIAPAMQVCQAIIKDGARNPTFPIIITSIDTTTAGTTKPHTSCTILWAVRTPSDLPHPILHELTHLAHLAAKYNISLTTIPHIDSHAQFITQADIQVALISPPSPHHHPRANSPSWREWIMDLLGAGEKKHSGGDMHDPRDKYIFVSGPEGFIKFFAGEKGEDGESQGSVGGVVREVVRWGRELERKALEGVREERKAEEEEAGEEEERKVGGVRRARWFVWKL
ncbi:hypothetical protein EV426DRAFT_589890 [Tirmania nivea]|nr:hypothetical protein EV426DRAFT_589890 [Tirmania nivea]